MECRLCKGQSIRRTDDTGGEGQTAAVLPPSRAWAKDKQSNMTYGTSAENGCSGNIPAIPRLHFPGLCLSDAGNGLRGTDFVNSYPSGIHVGAR